MTAGSDSLKSLRTAQAEALLAGLVADLIETDDGKPLLVITAGPVTKAITDPIEARRCIDSMRTEHVHQAA